MAVPKKHHLILTNKQVNHLLKSLGVSNVYEIDIPILKKLKENLKQLSDTRQQSKISYKIWDVVMWVILCNFANIYNWEDINDFVHEKYDWFRSFLLMTGGVPSSQTYERIFSLIHPKELETILTDFFLSITHCNTNNVDIINILGRVDKGSSRNETDFNKKQKPLNVLNAYSNKYGIYLASEMILDKTNEIPTIPIILERLKIKDTIITWDVLNTQKENIKCVIDKKKGLCSSN